MAYRLTFGTYRLHRTTLTQALDGWFGQVPKPKKTNDGFIVDSSLTYDNMAETAKWLANIGDLKNDFLLGTKVGLRSISTESLSDQVARAKSIIEENGWSVSRSRILLHRQRPYEQYVEFARAASEAGFFHFGVCNVDPDSLEALVQRLTRENLERLMPAVVQVEVHPYVDCARLVERCHALGLFVEGHSLFRGGHFRPKHSKLFDEMASAVTVGENEEKWTAEELLVAWALHHLGVDSLAIRSTSAEHWAGMLRVAQMTKDDCQKNPMLLRVFGAMSHHSSHWGTVPSSRVFKICSKVQRQQEKFNERVPAELPKDPAHAAVILASEWAVKEPSALSIHTVRLGQILPPRSAEQKAYVNALALSLVPSDRITTLEERIAAAQKKGKIVTPEDAQERRMNSLVSHLMSMLKEHRQAFDRHRYRRRQNAKGHCCVLKSKQRDPLTSPQIRFPEAMPVSAAPETDVDVYMNLLASGGNPDTPGVLPWPAKDHDGLETPHGTLFLDGRSDFCKQSDSPEHFAKLCEAVRAGWRVPLPDGETIQRWQAEGKPLVFDGRVRHFLIGNNVSLSGSIEPLLGMLNDREVQLETLYVAGNRINSENLAKICEHLMDHPTMRALWLKRNPLGQDKDGKRDTRGFHALGRLIATNDRIRVLDLDNTCLLPDGLLAFAEGMISVKKERCGLRHLYLNANGLGVEEGATLMAALAYMPELRTLYLGMNGLGDLGCFYVVSGLVRHTPKLRSLSLASNAWKSRESQQLRMFLDMCARIGSLKSLDLGCYKSTRDLGCQPNFIGETPGALDLLREFLEHQAPRLEHFVIRRNGFTDLIGLLDLLAWATLAKNCGRPLSIEARQMDWPMKFNVSAHEKKTLRLMRHTRRVVHIDSIYRNRMKLE